VNRRRFVQVAALAPFAGAGLATVAALADSANAASGEVTIGWPGITYRTEVDRASIGMYPLNTNVFESLVRLTPDYQVEPMLAETWEFVEPNTWRFNLRKGVTFHDGSPLNAEAVKWSMDRLARGYGGAGWILAESTEIIDEHTVEITPADTNRRLIEQLVHPSRGSIIANGSEPANQRIGTGPFREVEYITDDRYVVEAFEGYWGEAPAVERITFRFFPDPTTRVLALQAGEVDMIAEVPRESVIDVEGDTSLRILTSPVGAYSAFYINIHGSAPYDIGQDRAVREAIARAVDKDAIVQGVWQGNAEAGVSMIPPAILGEQASVVGGTSYDPEAAKAILEAAGWKSVDGGGREKDGRKLELEMVVGYPTAASHGQMPEFLQAQLAEVGISVTIVSTPDTGTYEALLQEGKGDLWVESGSQNDANPCFLPAILFASPDPSGDAESNMYGNSFGAGPDFDEFMLQCSVSETTGEVQSAAANAMRLVIDEEFIVVPLAGVFRIFGAGPRIASFDVHPSGVNQRWTSLNISE
jgi:peptide/nickel transport system substrate-binding protein